jgi:hypothetical protein
MHVTLEMRERLRGTSASPRDAPLLQSVEAEKAAAYAGAIRGPEPRRDLPPMVVDRAEGRDRESGQARRAPIRDNALAGMLEFRARIGEEPRDFRHEDTVSA